MRRLPHLAAVALFAITHVAAAIAPLGSEPRDFVAADPEDRAIHLSAFRGRPTVVVYEDKDARDQNAQLKERLAAIAKKGPAAGKVGFFGVADVKAWNFWPARGFVKDDLRAQRERWGIAVYADWTGDGRVKLDAASGQSNVLLLDARGKVRWARSGKITADEEKALTALIYELARGPAAGDKP